MALSGSFIKILKKEVYIFMLRKKMVFIGLLLALILVVAGCGEGNEDSETVGNAKDNEAIQNDDVENEDNKIMEDPDPITLTIMMWDDWGNYEEDIEQAIENEFPYITVENIGGDTGNKDAIEDALANGIVPDIIFAHRQYHVQLLEEYQLAYDMTDLLEKHEFDLSRYDPAHVDEWRSWANGEIWLLPFMRDIYALQYNKDVFDVFGVDYPTDGMTWEEVVQLAEQVTGERNGIQYQGIDLRGNGHLPLSQIVGNKQLIDPETDEVLWVDDPYLKEWLELVDRVNNNPNNIIPEDQWPWEPSETLAMRTMWLEMNLPDGYNVDLVTFPQWEDAPNIGPLSGGWGFGITEPSEHKDDAMQVIKFLYEDDHIMKLGASLLNAPFNHLYSDINIDSLLTDDEKIHYEGTNLEALYKLDSPGGPEKRSSHDAGAFEVIENIGFDFIEAETDVNTFLRQLKEEEEIRVEEEKARGY